MSAIRELVAEMRARGEVEVLQKGQVLRGDLGPGLEKIVGPIRIRGAMADSRTATFCGKEVPNVSPSRLEDPK